MSEHRGRSCRRYAMSSHSSGLCTTSSRNVTKTATRRRRSLIFAPPLHSASLRRHARPGCQPCAHEHAGEEQLRDRRNRVENICHLVEMRLPLGCDACHCQKSSPVALPLLWRMDPVRAEADGALHAARIILQSFPETDCVTCLSRVLRTLCNELHDPIPYGWSFPKRDVWATHGPAAEEKEFVA